MLPVRKRMATDKMKCRRAAPGLFIDRREAVLFLQEETKYEVRQIFKGIPADQAQDGGK